MAKPSLTILTWLWSQPGGRYTYTAEHVNIWAAMVSRNLSLPHRIACVTDMPQGLDKGIAVIKPPRDFEDVRIPTWGTDKPQCLRRLSMFRPDAAQIFGKRFVAMDMDCVVIGPLDPLFDRDDDIVLYRGTHKQRPYNGSMLMMNAGARPRVFNEFTPEGAANAGKRYIGSDQAWMSLILGPGEATWGGADGVHAYNSRWNEGEPRVTFFLGPPKPWEIAAIEPKGWIARTYRRDREGRALILGTGKSLWQDVAAALKGGTYDAVIAAPEAAKHWPGKVDAHATTDTEAAARARDLGFRRWTICGASNPA